MQLQQVYLSQRSQLSYNHSQHSQLFSWASYSFAVAQLPKVAQDQVVLVLGLSYLRQLSQASQASQPILWWYLAQLGIATEGSLGTTFRQHSYLFLGTFRYLLLTATYLPIRRQRSYRSTGSFWYLRYQLLTQLPQLPKVARVVHAGTVATFRQQGCASFASSGPRYLQVPAVSLGTEGTYNFRFLFLGTYGTQLGQHVHQVPKVPLVSQLPWVPKVPIARFLDKKAS